MVIDYPNDCIYEAAWWQPRMEDILTVPAEETHPLTKKERNEIAETLNLMNHLTAASREEYIARFEGHKIAICTKLNDLKSNLDLSRIPCPTQKDVDRIDRYKKEQALLMEMLWRTFPPQISENESGR